MNELTELAGLRNYPLAAARRDDDRADQRLHRSRRSVSRLRLSTPTPTGLRGRRDADPDQRRQSACLFRPSGEARPVPDRPGERRNLRRPRVHQGCLPAVCQTWLSGGRHRVLCPGRRSVEDDRYVADHRRRHLQGAGRPIYGDADATVAWAEKNQGDSRADRHRRFLPWWSSDLALCSA